MTEVPSELTIAQLEEHIGAAVEELAVWRRRGSTLFFLLTCVELAHAADIRAARSADEALAGAPYWQDVAATVVRWWHRYGLDDVAGPRLQPSEVQSLLRFAGAHTGIQDAVDAARAGLYAFRATGTEAWFTPVLDRGRDALDRILEQRERRRELGAANSVPRLRETRSWFQTHRRDPRALKKVPNWLFQALQETGQQLVRAQARLLPGRTALAGFNLDQAFAVWAYINSISYTASVVTAGLNTEASAIAHISQVNLIEHASHVTGVDADAVARFVDFVTWDPHGEIDPALSPLIPYAGELVIVPSLVGPYALERNVLRLAQQEPSTSGHLGKALGGLAHRFEEVLRAIPDVKVATTCKVRREGRVLGDLDVVAFDELDNFMMVLEVKWPLQPDSYAEHAKAEAIVTRGQAQLEDLRGEMRIEGTEVALPAGWKLDSADSAWFVATPSFLACGPEAMVHPVAPTSLQLLQDRIEAITSESPSAVLRRLADALTHVELPVEGRDWRSRTATFDAGDFKIHVESTELV